jgi:cobalt-zinc-cadmium efflux system outer membrane protein
VRNTRFIQPLPFWGKRDLKREAADGRGRSGARQSRRITWTEQAARIKIAYAQYFAVTGLIRLTRRMSSTWLIVIEGISRARYANGPGAAAGRDSRPGGTHRDAEPS